MRYSIQRMGEFVPGWLRDFALGVHLANGIRHGVPEMDHDAGRRAHAAGVRENSERARPEAGPAWGAGPAPVVAHI